MPSNRTFVINNIPLYPNEVERFPTRRATLLEADDGSLHSIERGNKRGYRLLFARPTPALTDTLWALYTASGAGTLTCIDCYGGVFFGLIPAADGISFNIAYRDPKTTFATTYEVGLTFLER